jgi:hypothetical protein
MNSGWPNWVNLRLLGDCFLMYVGQFFEDYISCPNFWVSFFSGKSCVLKLTKKWFGYILGDFFLKLIWSPWINSTFSIFFRHFNFRKVGLRHCYAALWRNEVPRQRSRHFVRSQVRERTPKILTEWHKCTNAFKFFSLLTKHRTARYNA